MNEGLLHTFTTEHQCPFPLNMIFFLYVSNLALDSPTFIHMDMQTFFLCLNLHVYGLIIEIKWDVRYIWDTSCNFIYRQTCHLIQWRAHCNTGGKI